MVTDNIAVSPFNNLLVKHADKFNICAVGFWKKMISYLHTITWIKSAFLYLGEQIPWY